MTRCATCGQPARRKCTRCGRLFCDLHVRYGNPHFSLGSAGGGTGYYCDDCWEAYRKKGAVWQKVFLIGVALFAVLFLIVSFLIVAGFVATGILFFLQ